MSDDGVVENASAIARRPLYVVIFSADERELNGGLFRTEPQRAGESGTVPHGLNSQVASALPALWYCLHLPNDLTQLTDLPAQAVCWLATLDISHNMLLLPSFMLDRLPGLDRLQYSLPSLVIAPDSHFDNARAMSEQLGFALPAIKYSDLSNETLKVHWQQLHQRLMPEEPYIGHEPSILGRLDLAPAGLPSLLLARHLGQNDWVEPPDGADVETLTRHAIDVQLAIQVVAQFEAEDATEHDAKQRWDDVATEKAEQFAPTVALSLPGVSNAYARRAFATDARQSIEQMPGVDDRDLWSWELSSRPDALVERAAIEFVVAHRAVGQGGLGITLPSLPPAAFTALAELERHFEGHENPQAVWRLLERIDKAAGISWTAAIEQAIRRASKIVAFTNFPIGLLTLPGDSSPLLTCTPIAYRPILPLTSAVQLELDTHPGIVLSKRCRILVVECISDSDPVGVASRQGWDVAASYAGKQGVPIEMHRAEVSSAQQFRAIVAEHQPDILVISAHGSLQRGRSMATLMIGDEPCVGPELGPLPPVVILSACYTAPRGAGIISVADLLLRQGALAVLGTQVPVNVARNAALMVRLFVYIGEAIAGHEEHMNLLDIWHRVQTSNAVNDVLQGSPSLFEWGRSTTASGRSVLSEFMTARSGGRLHRGEIYRDTEDVLGDIADDMGMGQRVRNWFRRPGYVPESLFYVLIGRPEVIHVNDPHAASGVTGA